MILKTKLIISSVTVALLLGLIAVIGYQHKKIERINAELSVQANNSKAYEAEASSLKERTLQFQYTIDQLNYSQDSLVQKLNAVRKELKIKDKNLRDLENVISHNSKTDTIRLVDTIFRDKNFSLDTTIQDNWASLKLKLEYPSNIDAEYSFKNDMTILASSKKETIEAPKKWWICRLFQKKHTVIEVDVVQENPYCTVDSHKHIKIIK